MITCSECGTPSLEGILYCEECGNYLLLASRPTTQTLSTEQLGSLNQHPNINISSVNVHKVTDDTLVSIQFNDNQERVNLSLIKTDVIFGRKDETIQLFPDVDLTPFGALEKGVSRKHAALRRKDDMLTVIDLGSANGTYLNGQRLSPNQPHVVRDGDEVSFGKLTTHIFFK